MRWVVISLSLVVSAAAQQSALRDYGRLPLVFEPNHGQTDPAVRFLARTGRGTLFLTDGGAVFGSVRIRLSGSRKPKAVQGLEPTGGVSNYFIGNDPAKWRTAIPHYSRVEYKSVYAGVDLVYYGNQGQLEYDFVVAPGADPRLVTLAFEGAREVHIDARGELVLGVEGGEVRQHKPVVYQEVAGVKAGGGRPLCDEGEASGGLSGGRLRSEPATDHRSRARLFHLPGRQQR